MSVTAFSFGLVIERKFSGGSIAKPATFLREQDQVRRMRIVFRISYAVLLEMLWIDNSRDTLQSIKGLFDFLQDLRTAALIKHVNERSASLCDNLNGVARAFLRAGTCFKQTSLPKNHVRQNHALDRGKAVVGNDKKCG